MPPNVRNSAVPTYGNRSPPFLRTRRIMNFVTITSKTSVPNIEWNATRSGVTGPAGPAMHEIATTIASTSVTRPTQRCIADAVACDTGGKFDTGHRRAASITGTPDKRKTVVAAMTFHSRRLLAVILLRNPTISIALPLQADRRLHRRM